MRTVLIVDDEYGIAEILADILSAEGYDVVTAMNGKLGLASLAQTRPALILLDVMMPVMTGPEMLRVLKDSDEYRDIPVILMSAAELSALPSEVTQRADALLQEPFDDGELVEALQRVLDGRASPS